MAETQSGGIIFPPPDIRGVIDTTAQFVAKHGKSFEERVQREQSSAKFAFLQPDNPYRAYFDMRVSVNGAERGRPGEGWLVHVCISKLREALSRLYRSRFLQPFW